MIRTLLNRTATLMPAGAAALRPAPLAPPAPDPGPAVPGFDLESYEPVWWLRNRHLVSIWAHYKRPPLPPYRRERVVTHDDDFLDLDWIDGDGDHPLLLACHGLEGSSDSPYIRAVMHAVWARGWHGVVLNYRGCSGTDNARLYAYHCGWTVDLDFVVRTLVVRNPHRPVLLVGYSLGGGIVANWLGRRATEVPPQVRAAFLCSTPFYLTPCSEKMERGFSRVYQRHFVQTLRRKALRKAREYPGAFDRRAVRRARTLRQFDAAFTCPISGFRSVEDYYEQASCGPHLGRIRVPTLVLNAADDPLIPESGAPPAAVEGAPAVRFIRTAYGGHVGFVGGPAMWRERQVLGWFDACLAGAPRETCGGFPGVKPART